MCSGDLGMYRVMPWALPTIEGGSVVEQTATYIESINGKVVRAYLAEDGNYYLWLQMPVTYNDKDAIKSFSTDLTLTSNTFTARYITSGYTTKTTTITVKSTTPILNSSSVGSEALNINYRFEVTTPLPSDFYMATGWEEIDSGYNLSKVDLYSSDGKMIQEISI